MGKISYLDYKKVQEESDYAAWVLSHGYVANHFTVSVTDCTFFKNLEQINLFLKQNGFEINSSGGEIKGSSNSWFGTIFNNGKKYSC